MSQGITFYANRYVDHRNVRLATLNSASGRDAQLLLGFRDGNPRIVVYTGEQGRAGVLNFPMDLVTGTVLMNMLKDLATTGKPGDRRVLDSKGFVYVNGQKADNEMVVKATAHIGVSKSGIIYISISETAPEKQSENKLIFQFALSEFHSVKDQHGEPVEAERISRMVALATADLMLGAIAEAMVGRTKEDFCSPAGKQFGKGLFDPVTKKMIPYMPGGQTSTAGNGGSESKPKSPPVFDDLDAEIPF